ncbi:MAG: sensor domain-containing diguanylate cyclase [Bacillus sp. (in: Bacteria)]|nr:sensor domain-containing diguanylate cyclase [Bacillus sp. (in: firmicutes)]MCM1427472.1 sensor domain-containing diguanylate cyclase [Eubacterium sp.]
MDKQTKSILVQWIGPTIIMIFIIGIMLFNFSVKSKAGANDMVTKSMTAAAEICTLKFKERLELLETVGRPIGELLEKESSLKSAHAVELAEIAMRYSGAYAVYICGEDGKGLNSAGEKISIAQTDYFEQIREAADVSYLFTMDDGIKAQSAIIVTVPLNAKKETGNLVLYYPLANFESVIKQADTVGWKASTLIDTDGMVLTTSCTGAHWSQGDNVYDKIGDVDVSRRIKNRIGGRLSGMSNAVVMQDATYSFVYAPLGINNWALLASIGQDYVDEQVSLQWRNARNMLYQLAAVILIFCFVIIGINMISKVYNIKKQKQLEEKADTDLLTGLNNKLATERKIKEFIEKYPDKQSMMFILDIDNFKKINDTMGHAFGDEVLRSLGKQIGVLFRATDIVGRAGGDEFIIFLKDIADMEAIKKEAKKVEDFFKDFKAGEYTKYSATASIGVAIFPKEGNSFENIYKAADQALYKAKKRGKNQLAFYHDMDEAEAE